jgi:hypothetical protein
MSFILGNEHLHQLTAQGNYSLRINMGDFDNNQRYAVYSQFVRVPKYNKKNCEKRQSNIPTTQKYMTAHLSGLIQALQ